MSTRRRVVITGLGIVSPAGIGWQPLWESVSAGCSSISRITSFNPDSFPSRIAGQVPCFDIEEYVPFTIAKQTDRFVHFLLASLTLALGDAGLDLKTLDPERIGCICGNNLGGVHFGERELRNLHAQGVREVSPYQAIAWFYAAGLGQLSINHRFKGICKVFVADRAGSAVALGYAMSVLRRGEADVVFCGGSEAPLAPYGMVGYQHTGLLSTRNDEPEKAYLPFDVERSGLVLGEGGAVLVMEELEHARRRGASIYAELTGYGTTCDGVHHKERARDGKEFARAISLALEDGDLTPDDIDYINADGEATEDGDLTEAQAIHMIFGQRASTVPVSVPKAAIGHMFGGATAADMIINALVLKYGSIPPTAGLERPDPRCEISHVMGSSLNETVETALLNCRGRGGINYALTARRWDS